MMLAAAKAGAWLQDDPKAADGRKVQQAMTMLNDLLTFCSALTNCHASYRLSVDRPEADRDTLDVPGERWESDFFAEGHVELEQYVGQGVVDAGPAELEAALRYYDSD